MNNPRYERSNVTELDTALGRKMRDLWRGYDWNLSDAEFAAWRQHLSAMNCTISDLRLALFDYAHGGGIFKPRLGDLKTDLRRHRDKRTGKDARPKPKAEGHEVTEEGIQAMKMMKELTSRAAAQPAMTREQELALYAELTGK